MGRYEKLNAASQDVVDCMVPAIAANFGVQATTDVIPQDIRMRVWNCDRREHVIDKAEDDARNWGLQFLKDLVTISRLKKAKLEEFQADLRGEVQKHSPGHPWAKFSDIQELKKKYTTPECPADDTGLASEESYSSDSSYYEELVVKEEPGYKKRGRKTLVSRKLKNDEVYESRQVKSQSGNNRSKRLRRSDSEGWERPDKSRRHEDDSFAGNSIFLNGNDGLQDMSLEELELSLQVAEAELKTARLKLRYLASKREREQEAKNEREVGVSGVSKKDLQPNDQVQLAMHDRELKKARESTVGCDFKQDRGHRPIRQPQDDGVFQLQTTPGPPKNGYTFTQGRDFKKSRESTTNVISKQTRDSRNGRESTSFNIPKQDRDSKNARESATCYENPKQDRDVKNGRESIGYGFTKQDRDMRSGRESTSAYDMSKQNRESRNGRESTTFDKSKHDRDSRNGRESTTG